MTTAEFVAALIVAVLGNVAGWCVGSRISQSAKETPRWWRILYPKKYRRYP